MILKSIEEYHQLEVASYSALKKLYKDINKIDDEVSNIGMVKGNLFEYGLNFGIDAYRNYVTVVEEEEYPSETVRQACDELFKAFTIDVLTPKFIAAYIQESMGKFKNYKLDTLIKKVEEEASTYLDVLQSGKIVVDTQLDENISSLIEYGRRKFAFIFEDPQLVKQLPIVQDYQGIQVKVLPDYLIDKNDYIQLYDAKYTYNDPRYFSSQYFSMMYYIQKQLYSEVVEKEFGKPVKFSWIVGTDFFMKGRKSAYVCQIADETVPVPINNELVKIGERKVPSLQALIDGYVYHMSTQDFSLPYKLLKTNTFNFNGDFLF